MLLLLLPLMVMTAGCKKADNTGSSKPGSTQTSTSVKKTIYVTDFTLEKDSFDLEVGGTAEINATLAPKNASKKGFNYASKDAKVATVSSDGVITAIGEGTCKIEVETKGTKEDGSTVKKEVTVNVKAPALVSLTVANSRVLIKEGATAQISYEVKPSNAVDKSVTYKSEDEAVATVSATGLITGVAAGETDIVLTTNKADKDGKKLTAKVHVTVESLNVVHKVEFQNFDGSLLQAVDEIEEGTVPEFTADAPSKATDDNGIYIFRGFDKEIVPYQATADNKPVVYKAVYETTDVTPRKATLTKAVDSETNKEKAVLTVTGEAKGYTTASIKEKAYLALAKKGGDWGTTYSDPLSPVINADGTWTMQMDVTTDKFALDTIYMGKYVWDGTASNAQDLKLFHKADTKRYRHTAEGKTMEDNKFPDTWDGVLPENYVSEGYINDTTTSQYSSVEDRQAFADAIAAPTWVGLGLTYDPADFMIGNNHYTFFTNDDVWQLPSILIEGTMSMTGATATLVEKNGVVYYRVQGSAADFATAGDVSGFFIDLQHNDNIDKKGWGTDVTVKDGVGTITDEKKWYYDYPVSDNDTLKDVEAGGNTYTVHFGLPESASADLKCDLATDYAPIVKDGLQYFIRKDASTWQIAALVIDKAPEAAVSEVSKLGYEVKNGNQVYLNLDGKIEGVSGACKLVAGTRENDITVGADGKFTASVRVDDAMALNAGNGSGTATKYALKVIDSAQKEHLLKVDGLNDDVSLQDVSATCHDAVTEGGNDVTTNFVFVSVDGMIHLTTVASTWTATSVKLSEKDGKAMLHVTGTLLKGTKVDGLKLMARAGSNDMEDSFALTSSMYDANNGSVSFDCDITAWKAMAGAQLKMQNSDGATKNNGDGRGINWFWCNDWTAVRKGDAVKIGNKTYSLSFSGKVALTIAEEAAA